MARRTDIEDRLIGKFKVHRRDFILILYDEVPDFTKSDGGVWVPGNMTSSRMYEKVGTATVISVGEGIPHLKTGDRILVNRVYGKEVPHNDSGSCKLAQVTANQIEAVLTGAPERDDYDFELEGVTL